LEVEKASIEDDAAHLGAPSESKHRQTSRKMSKEFATKAQLDCVSIGRRQTRPRWRTRIAERSDAGDAAGADTRAEPQAGSLLFPESVQKCIERMKKELTNSPDEWTETLFAEELSAAMSPGEAPSLSGPPSDNVPSLQADRLTDDSPTVTGFAGRSDCPARRAREPGIDFDGADRFRGDAPGERAVDHDDGG
jgi:hypothetical protein